MARIWAPRLIKDHQSTPWQNFGNEDRRDRKADEGLSDRYSTREREDWDESEILERKDENQTLAALIGWRWRRNRRRSYLHDCDDFEFVRLSGKKPRIIHACPSRVYTLYWKELKWSELPWRFCKFQVRIFKYLEVNYALHPYSSTKSSV